MKLTLKSALAGGIAGLVMAAVTAGPALSHHSFAMYDQTTTKTVTGKLTRFIPGANHAQIHFELLNPDGTAVKENGQPVRWGVETGPAASLARFGVTVNSFPVGAIITVTLHPLRDGRNFGSLTPGEGVLIGCGMTMPKGGCTAQTGTPYIIRGQ